MAGQFTMFSIFVGFNFLRFVDLTQAHFRKITFRFENEQKALLANSQ